MLSNVNGIQLDVLEGQDITAKAGKLTGWSADDIFEVMSILGQASGNKDTLFKHPKYSYLAADEFSEELKSLENRMFGIQKQAENTRRKLRQKSSVKIQLDAAMLSGIWCICLKELRAGNKLNVRKVIEAYQPATGPRLTTDMADKLKQRSPSSEVKKVIREQYFKSKFTELGKFVTLLDKSERSMLLRGSLADTIKMLQVLWNLKYPPKLEPVQAEPLKKM